MVVQAADLATFEQQVAEKLGAEDELAVLYQPKGAAGFEARTAPRSLPAPLFPPAVAHRRLLRSR